jgi:5-methylthioadenosine/S-adenosylhomocysteine deaminase
MSGILSFTAGCSSNDSYNSDIIISNTIIVTMDADFRIIEDGAIVICGDSILAIGNSQEILSKYNAPKIIDGKGKMIMPGLINTHTHSPMVIFRGFADDLPLHEWLYDHIFPIEAEFITKENVSLGAKLAIAEMLQSGTTTFNDMYYFGDEIAHVVEKAGIRAVITEGLIDFAVPNSDSPEDGINYTERMIKKWAGHSLVTIGVATHAPYSSSGELIIKSKALADKYNVPFNIHVAETRKEFDQIMSEHGLTPVGYLNKLGVLSPNLVMAHGVHLTQEDVLLVAKSGAGIAHNPECNMKLASGVAPIPDILAAGGKVGLGTDGVASNNNLDMFDEMNTAALLHKLYKNDPTVLDARTVVEMATIGGARVLCMDDKIGSLEIGKKADIIILDLSKPHSHPLYNVYSQIVYSMKSSDVETTIVNGQIVMENRNVIHIDEKALYAKIDSLAVEIRKHADAR